MNQGNVDFNVCRVSGVLEGWRVYAPRWPGDLPSATAYLAVRDGQRVSSIFVRTTEGCMERLVLGQKDDPSGRVVIHGRMVEEKWRGSEDGDARKRGRIALHTGRIETWAEFEASEEWRKCIEDVETNRRLLGVGRPGELGAGSAEFELLNGLTSVPWERGEGLKGSPEPVEAAD